MKAEIMPDKKDFNPVEIKITIQSEQELCELYHRLNISVTELEKTIDSDCEIDYIECPSPQIMPLFFVIKSLAQKYGRKEILE